MKMKYITFNTSEDFEKWQNENPKIEIIQITPLLSGLSMSKKTPICLSATIAPCAVFVLYTSVLNRNEEAHS